MPLITPDNFEKDWRGWLSNQTGHISLGVLSVFALSMIGFMVMGEFPYRVQMFLIIAIAYIGVIELYIQGWQGWDTIEDSVFVVGYGAAAPLAASVELEPGKAVIIMDLEPLIPYFCVCIAHLIAGSVWRMAKT